MRRMICTQRVSEVVLEATVIRADGTVEHLGEIAYYHRNPLKRMARRLKKWLQS